MTMVSVLMKILNNFHCKCGAKNCCGYIVREGSRWRIKKNRNNGSNRASK